MVTLDFLFLLILYINQISVSFCLALFDFLTCMAAMVPGAIPSSVRSGLRKIVFILDGAML